MGMPGSYEGVALVAPVSCAYSRFSDHDTPWFVAAALRELIAAAGIEKSDVDGLALSSFTNAPDSAIAMTRTLGISPRFIEDTALGGASGIVAMRRAARAIQAGDAEVIACIGADTNKREGFRDLVSNFSRASTDAVYPYGAAGPNLVFAMITQNYMDRFGATREDFARLCVSQRQNVLPVPHALQKKPLSVEDYLGAKPIAEPLHLFDCVMPCAGAEAFFVMSVDRATSLGVPYATICGSIERHNAYSDDPVPERGGWAVDMGALYEQASLGPKDMDCVQTYDDYPVISLLQLEAFGFCTSGGGAKFLQATDLSVAGDLPHNTCGGQLSVGQAGAAGGYLGIVEAIRQVTGQAVGEKVADCNHAIVGGYGMVAYDRCLATSAAIIAGADA